MATLNPFDLLGVDAEDPSQIAVALPKKVEKAAPVLPAKAAKLQSKQAPPSQAGKMLFGLCTFLNRVIVWVVFA